jgi:hypothetical protein
MVAVSIVSLLPSSSQHSLDSGILDTSCPNCFVLKEQLEIATEELQSARTIISLLKEDINSTCDFPVRDNLQHHQASADIQSATDLNWTAVTCRANMKKVLTPNNICKTDLQIASSNRFSSQDNLKVHQRKYESHTVNNSVKSPAIRPRKN